MNPAVCHTPLMSIISMQLGPRLSQAGAAANVQTTSFIGNSVVNYGDFGGAIFHDYVRHSQNPKSQTCQVQTTSFMCNTPIPLSTMATSAAQSSLTTSLHIPYA